MIGLDVVITINNGHVFISACSFLRLLTELKHSGRDWADD